MDTKRIINGLKHPMDYTTHKPPSCELCTLYYEPGICWGAGDTLRAKLIYIGQNPGQHEVDATARNAHTSRRITSRASSASTPTP